MITRNQQVKRHRECKDLAPATEAAQDIAGPPQLSFSLHDGDCNFIVPNPVDNTIEGQLFQSDGNGNLLLDPANGDHNDIFYKLDADGNILLQDICALVGGSQTSANQGTGDVTIVVESTAPPPAVNTVELANTELFEFQDELDTRAEGLNPGQFSILTIPAGWVAHVVSVIQSQTPDQDIYRRIQLENGTWGAWANFAQGHTSGNGEVASGSIGRQSVQYRINHQTYLTVAGSAPERLQVTWETIG